MLAPNILIICNAKDLKGNINIINEKISHEYEYETFLILTNDMNMGVGWAGLRESSIVRMRSPRHFHDIRVILIGFRVGDFGLFLDISLF